MYALEQLVLQRPGACSPLRWKQVAICGRRALLDKVRAGQQRPGEWRVVFIPCSLQTVMKGSARAA